MTWSSIWRNSCGSSKIIPLPAHVSSSGRRLAAAAAAVRPAVTESASSITLTSPTSAARSHGNRSQHDADHLPSTECTQNVDWRVTASNRIVFYFISSYSMPQWTISIGFETFKGISDVVGLVAFLKLSIFYVHTIDCASCMSGFELSLVNQSYLYLRPAINSNS